MTAKDIQKQWIKAALSDGKQKGKTQKGIADALNLDQSQGHRIAKGTRLLNFAEVALVERYLGKRAPRGITGEEDNAAHDGARYFAGPERDFIDVPVFEQRIPPGAGLPPGDLTPIRILKFDVHALNAITKNTHTLYALCISTDAASPFLNPGDDALVDPKQTNLSRQGRFVVRVNDELLIKLITMNPSSRMLTVKSDNPDYPSYENIKPAELDVAGRVIWYSRRLP